MRSKYKIEKLSAFLMLILILSYPFLGIYAIIAMVLITIGYYLLASKYNEEKK